MCVYVWFFFCLPSWTIISIFYLALRNYKVQHLITVKLLSDYDNAFKLSDLFFHIFDYLKINKIPVGIFIIAVF